MDTYFLVMFVITKMVEVGKYTNNSQQSLFNINKTTPVNYEKKLE